MDKNILNYIVSPVNHGKLSFSGGSFCECDGTKYKIIKSVPVLLPEKISAKWQRELIEIILWEYPEEIEKLYKEIKKSDDYSKIYIKYIKKLLKNKQGITDALERYALQNTEKWLCQSRKPVNLSQMLEFNKYAAKNTGKKRTETKINATGIFEVYPHFARAVCENNPETVLELGTGAGGGTASVALEMKENTKLFTVDIGFECLGNAVGIAKYQNKKIIPICANFWYLPFADNSFDVVCTYNGLDESRENESSVSEISRILKTGGKFVAVSRKNSFMRQARVLEPFGFERDETIGIMKKCRLYSDIQTFDEICKKYSLILISRKEFIMNENLTSVLSAFEKDKQ